MSFPKIVRIKYFWYDVYTRNEYGEPEICLVPRTGGDVAKSGVSYDSYEYTHGGRIYQAAVERAKKLAKLLDSAPPRSLV